MAKAKNERNTENLVRDALRSFDYYDENTSILVEEQRSVIESVRRLLRAGSKSKAGGMGSPEFLISNVETPDFLIVIECKASIADHVSPAFEAIMSGEREEDSEQTSKRLKRYAVDGVVHYASLLAKDYNVIAVAVSGESKKSLKISTFLHTKGASAPKILLSKTNQKPIEAILPWHDYIDHAVFDPSVRRARLEDLMAFARELHVFMRDHAKLTESEKPLLVSGTLIALRNPAFAASYRLHKVKDLPNKWIEVIREEINAADIPRAKKDKMDQPYASIAVHPVLGKATAAYPKGPLLELIQRIYEKAAPFMSSSDSLDVIGQFYGEFLKYTGGDKKALGIVLTPRHITELFALIANVGKDSTVLGNL